MKKFVMLILGYIVSHAVYAQVATSIFENGGDAFRHFPELSVSSERSIPARSMPQAMLFLLIISRN